MAGENARPKTILLAAMSLNFGGAETHVLNLARGLKERGFPVLVASQGGILESDLRAGGIDHRPVPLHSRAPWQLLRAASRLRQLLASGDITLVHAHARIPAWAAERARAGLGIPLVTTYHGVYAAGPFWRRVTRWGDRVIAVSTEVRDHLTSALNVDPHLVTVIPNGIDTRRFAPGLSIDGLRREFGVTTGPVVVNVSRLSGPGARTASVLMELAESEPDRFSGLHVFIVGDGTELTSLQRRAGIVNERLGRVAVHVTGGRRDVERFFAVADLVVAVGRTALEAMASGRPVLVAGPDGIGDLITEDNFALFSRVNFTARHAPRPLDHLNLARHLKKVLLEPGLGARLGHFGREKVEEGYSVDGMVDAVARLYSQLGIEPGGAGGPGHGGGKQ